MAQLASTSIFGDLNVTGDIYIGGESLSQIIEGIDLTITVDDIPNLPASKITSGSFHVDRIPSLPATKITSGTIATARLPSASTSAPGIVQLSSSTSSTSTTLAATASAVKAAYDLANGKANASHNHSADNITSGTLGVARGGTGLSSITAGRILYGAGTSALGNSSYLTFSSNNLRIGNGNLEIGTGSNNRPIRHTSDSQGYTYRIVLPVGPNKYATS